MNALMGLLVAHSVAGKKLPSKDRSRLMLTSALLPAPGIAGVLTPMALAQKEVAEHERRQAQSDLSARGEAAQKLLQAFADAAVAVIKGVGDRERPLTIAQMQALASGFSKQSDVVELVKVGAVQPVVVSVDEKVSLHFGVPLADGLELATTALASEVLEAGLIGELTLLIRDLRDSRHGSLVISRGVSSAPPPEGDFRPPSAG